MIKVILLTNFVRNKIFENEKIPESETEFILLKVIHSFIFFSFGIKNC